MVDFIGAVRDPQFRQGVGQGLVDAAGRGLAMIGGAPVDLTTMFLRPLGYSVPDEQIIGSSEYLGRQMADMGLISQARNPAAEFLSALLIPDPTDIQKLAPYVQRAMNADLVAARPSTPGAAMRAQRGSVGVEPSGLEGYRIKNTPLGKTYRTEKGSISVMENSPYSPRPNSITEFFVDETERGKGVGKKILDDVLSQYDAESVSAAVSSPASLNLFYQKGFRPISNPSASKEEALKMMREDSSVTMVVPPRSQAPREEALRIAQENAAKPVSEGGSVGVEKPKFPAVKPGDIKTSYRGGEIIQKRKFDNDTEIELTVSIDKDDNLASAYLDAGGSGLETDGEVPTGTGTATAMYKNALRWAKDKGVGWISDSILSDQSQRMYERLIEQGIPFELGGLPGYPSQYFLSAEKLATLPDKVLAAKYSSENIDDGMPRLFDLLAAETSPPRPQAPREEALRIAQENAAKPVSEGGLGLPPDNTAMDRARAMGFDDADLYHGTTNDFPAFKVSDRSNVYATDEPRIADIYANAIGRHRGLREVNAGPNVMPLMYRGKLIEVSDQGAGGGGWVKDNLAAALGTEPKRNLYKEVPSKGYSGVKIKEMDDLGGRQSQYVFPDPSVLRSRFAAFDPARRYESDLLGSVDPRLLAILGPATAAAVYGLGELYANQRRDEQTR